MKPFAAFCIVLASAIPALAGEIHGDYIEARTADVYTGPCFSNAEVFLTGNHALMAWKVTDGSWNGVDLKGLSIAAAVKGTTTFSEDKPEEALSVLIVDEKATSAQREALIDMAKSLGKGRLDHVVATKSSTISLTVERHAADEVSQASKQESSHQLHATPKAALGSFWVPGLAEIVTRPLSEKDHSCGNEVVAYAPLSKGVKALPAYTIGNRFKGEGLNVNWDDNNNRGSFVGEFSY